VIIVDASVTLAWCLADEADEYAERVLDRVASDPAAAPGHWPLEVANGLLSAHRRGRIAEEELDRVAIMLDRLGIEVVPIELTTAMWTVLETARNFQLSEYDAAYLDLARFRGASLATLDEPLRRAAEAAGVSLAD
jgi:predicted nucleic acid-binding protein